MTDEMILRLAAEASEALSTMEFWITCHEFVHVYNRMLQSVQENHPGPSSRGPVCSRHRLSGSLWWETSTTRPR